jgi:hypothetical protein
MIFIVLLIILTFIIFKFFKDDLISQQAIITVWFIKLLFGLIYFLIVYYYYGHGHLYGDTGRFITEAKHVNHIAQVLPTSYIKLLFGLVDFTEPNLFPHINKTYIYLGGEHNKFINDNRLIIKLNSLIYFLSKGNVFVHILFHSFLSFIGSFLIFKSFKHLISNQKSFWWALMIIPSVNFWGSGITKESILLFALGLFFFSLKLLYDKKLIKGFVIFSLSCLLLLFNKPYVGVIIIPLSFVLIVGYKLNWQKKFLFIFTGLTVLFLTSLIILPSKFNITSKISNRQQDMINTSRGGVYFVTDSAFCYTDYNYLSNFEMLNDTTLICLQNTPANYKLFETKIYYPFILTKSPKQLQHFLTIVPSKSYFEITNIEDNPIQLIKNIPQALINTLIRPYPWDNGSNLKYLSFVQNILLIFFIGYCIKHKRTIINETLWIVTLFIIMIVILSLVIGWTTPVFGAIVRYKMPVDLFILLLSFLILKPLNYENKYFTKST